MLTRTLVTTWHQYVRCWYVLKMYLLYYQLKLGGMIVTPILTQFSDRFGRRLSFLIPLWITVASNIICSIAPNYYIFLIFRFIAGAGSSVSE
jgi:MFS family permease